MSVPRLVARLDVKGPNVIKGIHFEGLRVVGNPNEIARRYYENGAQELLFIDTVASLYGRNNLKELVAETAKDVFLPMTVGGGIRRVSDARALLSAGADKIAVNTAAVARPELLSELANEFGSQCVVLSVQAKRDGGSWEAYTEAGREHSGMDAISWICEAQELGVGELLVTSVDQDGTGKGFDLALASAVSDIATVPVIFGGGFGHTNDIVGLQTTSPVEAVAVGRAAHWDGAHFGQLSAELRRELADIE